MSQSLWEYFIYYQKPFKNSENIHWPPIFRRYVLELWQVNFFFFFFFSPKRKLLSKADTYNKSPHWQISEALDWHKILFHIQYSKKPFGRFWSHFIVEYLLFSFFAGFRQMYCHSVFFSIFGSIPVSKRLPERKRMILVHLIITTLGWWITKQGIKSWFGFPFFSGVVLVILKQTKKASVIRVRRL